MQLGQVIRKYRKNKNMTQEEMGGQAWSYGAGGK